MPFLWAALFLALQHFLEVLHLRYSLKSVDSGGSSFVFVFVLVACTFENYIILLNKVTFLKKKPYKV